MRTILFCLALAIPAFSADFVAAGVSFNGTTATPFGSYGKDLGSGIYAITSEQVTQIHLKPTITFQAVTTADIGYNFSKLLPAKFQARFGLIGLGGAGASASSTALTAAFDGGGLGIIHTSKFDVALGARIIRTAQAGTQTIPVAAVSFRWDR